MCVSVNSFILTCKSYKYSDFWEGANKISSTLRKKLLWRSYGAENVNRVFFQICHRFQIMTSYVGVAFIIVTTYFYKMEEIPFNIVC
jgi:hypothetical protein